MSIASVMSGMSGGKMPHERPDGDEPRGAGEEQEGPHEYLKEMQENQGGSHMHIHSDGMTHTTHHIHEGGEVQGPHEHHDTEALKKHVGKFAEGEDGEKDGQEEHGSDSIFD